MPPLGRAPPVWQLERLALQACVEFASKESILASELSWKARPPGWGSLIHHEIFSEAVTGWAKGLCRLDCRLLHHHLGSVGVLITQLYSWGNDVQRSYVTCPRSPGQARKVFSLPLPASFCPFCTLARCFLDAYRLASSSAPPCEVQVQWFTSPFYRERCGSERWKDCQVTAL